jgi:NAD+ synthase
MGFNRNILNLNPELETTRICGFIREQVSLFKRDGVVIGLSGGVDSSLCSEMAVRALGADNVLGLILPEKESNPVSETYAAKQASKLGIKTITEDVTPTLTGFGTYRKRDSAIQEIFPDYQENYKIKIVLPEDILGRDGLNYYTLIVSDPQGNQSKIRLNIATLRRIVAATNTKQITRMMYLNYYAELRNYLVCGTTNHSEYIQGFFVKYGDGGVDLEPLVHLYKEQVYQLANFTGIIPEIINRTPSPDTFSYVVSDEEMYFRMPYQILDYLLYAWEHNIQVSEVSSGMNLSEEQVQRAWRDFKSKYQTTRLARLPSLSLPKDEK